MTSRWSHATPIALRRALAALVLASVPVGPAFAYDLQVVVTGETDLEDQVRAASLLASAEDEGGGELTDTQDIIASARADYTRIVGRLYSRGYYAPVVSIRLDGVEAFQLDPLDDPGRIDRAVIEVQTGPPFVFGRAEIDPIASSSTEVPEGFAPGEPAETGIIREAVAATVIGWRERGHAKAELEDQTITARHRENELDVDIEIAPGPVVVFGPTTVVGARMVRESAILRIAGIDPGLRFDPDVIERAQRRLRRTGAFRAVAITEADELAPGAVLPLRLTVVEAPPRRVGFGGEVRSDTGFSVQAYWMHRNLFGGAERLRFDLEGDGIGGNNDDDGEDWLFSTLFEKPGFLRPDQNLSFLVTLADEDEPNFKSESVTLNATITRFATDELTVYGGVEIRFANTIDAFGDRSFENVSFPFRAEYDRRDDELDPTDGYFIEAGLRPFVGLGEGDGTGGVLTADLRGFQEVLGDDRTIAAVRLQFGSVVGSDNEATPPEYLFFSGGGSTVRGQPFESLGIEVEGVDDLAGGRSLFAVQSEIRREITEVIGIVGFIDAGWVGEDQFGGTGEWHAGAGLGVRYKTGFGPIRVDVGAPVGGDTGEGLQLYIGIGQAF